jgi:WD40 repeat protein
MKHNEKVSKTNVSRRKVLLGLGGLGLAVAGYNSIPSARAHAASLLGTANRSSAKLTAGQTIVTYQDSFVGGVNGATWSPDSASVAVGSYNHAIDIFNSSTGRTTARLSGQSNNGAILSWAANGRYLASTGPGYSGDTTVKIWNVQTGKLVNTYKGHTSSVNFVAFSPDGTRVASAANDHTIQVWDPSTFQTLYTYTVIDQNNATRLAWSPDGTYIVSGVDGLAAGYVNPTARVWNSHNGKQLTSWSGNVNSLAWSPDGTSIASAEGLTLVLRYAQTGSAYNTYTYTAQTLSTDWSRNGESVVVSGGSTQSVNNDGFAQVITLSTNARLNYAGHTQPVLVVAFSPDSTRVVSGSLDDTAKVWEA